MPDLGRVVRRLLLTGCAVTLVAVRQAGPTLVYPQNPGRSLAKTANRDLRSATQ